MLHGKRYSLSDWNGGSGEHEFTSKDGRGILVFVRRAGDVDVMEIYPQAPEDECDMSDNPPHVKVYINRGNLSGSIMEVVE